ncbi:MAG: site-2 protease family protein [Clostridia bacterium]|nr:site-2 protease family protein [Clostridia bacterium]
MLLSIIRGSGVSWYNVIAAVLSSLAVIFLTLPIHEFSHAFVATKLGDPTPKFQGRLTLNPFAHIDYIGALCIILFGFGWAKPVQINARYFKSPKWGMALSSLAGPLSNIVVAFISLIIYNAVRFLPVSNITFALRYFFYYLAQINVYLAVFNLIPIPPLDGSRILFSVLPQKYYFAVMRYERYIYIALLALLWLGVLTVPLNILSNLILGGLSNVAALPFNLI